MKTIENTYSVRICRKDLTISTKRRLAKFNGVKSNFEFHLKECERRWNKKSDELQQELIKLLKKYRNSKIS